MFKYEILCIFFLRLLGSDKGQFKMDFSFVDKNNRCTLIVTANNGDMALELLKQKVKYPEEWKMDIIGEDGDETG